jgi:hypothetical protein
MVDIRNYMTMSGTASSVKDIFITPNEFYESYNKIFDRERKSFIRHILINNVPFAFKNQPLLFEQIVQYLSDKLEVSPSNIKIIGSGKSGFSMSPPPDYGSSFGQNSDLDFSIVYDELFYELENEFNSWAEQYQNGQLSPKNLNQKKYWSLNLVVCPKTLRRGFIDLNKIPSYDQFIKTRTMNNSLYLIKEKLDKIYNLKIKKASIRVYKNWPTFSNQLKLNTETVLRQIA